LEINAPALALHDVFSLMFTDWRLKLGRMKRRLATSRAWAE